MANWQRNLNLKDLWEAYEKEEIDIVKLAHEVGNRCRCVQPFAGENAYLNDELEEIADAFECFDGDANDFDQVMGQLYDWADIQIGGGFFDAKKVCWVRTNF